MTTITITGQQYAKLCELAESKIRVDFDHAIRIDQFENLIMEAEEAGLDKLATELTETWEAENKELIESHHENRSAQNQAETLETIQMMHDIFKPINFRF